MTIFDHPLPLTPLEELEENKNFEFEYSIAELDVCIELDDACAKEHILDEIPLGELCKEVL